MPASARRLGSVTASLTGPSDPSTADTSAGFHYSFALTAGGLAGSYATAGTANSATFSFNDGPSSSTIYSRIFDNDVIRMHEIKVSAVTQAIKQRMRLRILDLIPADLRHVRPIFRKAHDAPTHQAQPLMHAELMAFIKH